MTVTALLVRITELSRFSRSEISALVCCIGKPGLGNYARSENHFRWSYGPRIVPYMELLVANRFNLVIKLFYIRLPVVGKDKK